jgi:hypothetical protein
MMTAHDHHDHHHGHGHGEASEFPLPLAGEQIDRQRAITGDKPTTVLAPSRPTASQS